MRGSNFVSVRWGPIGFAWGNVLKASIVVSYHSTLNQSSSLHTVQHTLFHPSHWSNRTQPCVLVDHVLSGFCDEFTPKCLSLDWKFMINLAQEAWENFIIPMAMTRKMTTFSRRFISLMNQRRSLLQVPKYNIHPFVSIC